METQPGQPQAPESPATLHCRVPSPATSPKLDQDSDTTNSTTPGYEKTLPSYDQSRVDRKHTFLAAQKSGASTTDAARIAGVHRTTPYFWRDQDPEFAEAWRESRDTLIENLEIEAFQRAAKGNDRLLMFLLKSFKPETYNRRPPATNGHHPDPYKAFSIVELLEKVSQWPLDDDPADPISAPVQNGR